jgi:dipeptidyl aminopeptidase/acylaminoacyl peptidase
MTDDPRPPADRREESDGETPDPAAVMGLPSLKQAAVAPDGDRVAFYYTGGGSNDIHVLDPATGERERWTDGGAGDTNIWPLRWSADGERVLFHRDDAAGAEQYDVCAVDEAGRVERVVETDGSTILRGVGPDGRLLVRSNHDGSMDVYLADSEGELTRITERETPVYRAILGPESDRVAYPADGGIAVCDDEGTVERVLGVNGEGSSPHPVDWTGDRLLVSDDSSGVTRAGVYDLASGEATWFGGEYVEDPEFFLPDGDRVVALRKRDALTVPVVYDLETEAGREFDLPEGVANFGWHPHRVLADGRVLVAHATPTSMADLLAYDLASDDYEVVFERDHSPLAPEHFADPAYERVASDGVPDTRQAAVDHDPDEEFDVGTLFYDSGERPSPLVVFPHGGPHQSSRLTFRPYVQYLVRRGYSMLQVNFRGSTGRGAAFRDALHGDWGGAEQGDVATAAEHVLDCYDFLDPKRVGVYGGSFGGFSAYWQVVQYPELYDAGAAIVGQTDHEDMWENTVPQFRAGFLRRHLGTPGENPERYRERSPITHAGNLDAPLLMVHGENDPRVPVSQARRFRDRLLELGYEEGTDFEYEELAESGHWGDTSGVPEPLRLTADFFDRRL